MFPSSADRPPVEPEDQARPVFKSPQTTPEAGPQEDGVPSQGKRFSELRRIGPAFWTTASIFSLAANIILVVVLLLLARQLFGLKALVGNQLVGGLYTNFQEMDRAHILTTIHVKDTINVKDTIVVKDTIPVVFDLPLKQETAVTLTRKTSIRNATIYLNGAPVKLDIILPEGTTLNIALDLVVPVNQQVPVLLTVPVDLKVPVDMNVPVDIPLNQTELHAPFVGLQNVVQPYQSLLAGLPDSWQETPLCGPLTGWLCGPLLGSR